jgi:hypothetical protein
VQKFLVYAYIDATMAKPVTKKCFSQAKLKILFQTNSEETKATSKLWKNFFQSSCTKDALDAGIDEEVFATSTK